MFCSTIIPTIARDSLAQAVTSVLNQKFSQEDFEVIVVNDSGAPLPPEAWQESPQVRVIDTNRRERCFARNAGAAAARGRYLHFLDDDDCLSPNALRHFYKLSRTSDAAVLYGATQLVDRSGKPLIQLRHRLQGNVFLQVMAGEWIPLQSALVRADAFFEAGGFMPQIRFGEDVDLIRRLALHGDFQVMSALAARVGMGDEDSTTDYEKIAPCTRQGREWILDMAWVFQRLGSSTEVEEWSGRIPRIYLTSAVWNMRRGRPLTALSRGAYAGLGLVHAGRRLLTKRFWRDLARPYESVTFSDGFQRN
jgi:glycosyltransferase involved in cell wall biosynthesis